jgi:hypothetical protein
MIGVDVSLENPIDDVVAAFDQGDDRVGGHRSGSPGFRIVIQNRIDDRAASAARVGDNVADRVGRFVEKGGYLGFHLRPP